MARDAMPTVKLVATGRAAHAGNHHREGINAIWALCQVLLSLDPTKVTVTAIEGGTSRNTVPASASATITGSDEALAKLTLRTDVEGATVALDAG